MAVAFDAASGTAVLVSPGTALDITTLTVGSGANRALVAGIAFQAAPGTVTLKWDNGGTPQTMAQIVTLTGGEAIAQIYVLVAPTSGAKTLHASWTNSVEAYMNAVSFTGVDQTGGATSFPNATSATNTSSLTSSLTITSNTGDYTFSAIGSGESMSGWNQTGGAASYNHAGNLINYSAQYAAGAATVTHSVTLNQTPPSTPTVGTSIKAAGAAATIWVENPDNNYPIARAAVAVALAAASGLVWVPRPIPVTPNTKVAGWYQPLSIPLPVAKAQPGSSFVPFNTPQITAGTPQGWESIASAAPAVATVQAPNLPFIVPPFRVPSGWQSTSALAPPVAAPQLGYSFVPFNTQQNNTATIDKWQQPLSIPVLAPPVQVGSSFVPFNTLQVNTAPLGWYQALATTPPIPPAQFGFASVSYNVAPITNTIPGTGWYQALAATPASAPSQIGASFVPFNTPQTTAVSPYGWYQPLSLAPSVATVAYTQSAWVPAPFPTFTLAWQQPLASTPAPTSLAAQIGSATSTYNFPSIANSIPGGVSWQQSLASTPPSALVQSGSVSLSYNIQPLLNTVVGMPWQQPLSTPAPVAVVYQFLGSSFVPFDTAQVIVVTTIQHSNPFMATVGAMTCIN